ncbi:MAG: multicopper oxidase domain-containing protein, partial [Deltaproteobacteria bacterium]|nr:multicopper oxidase domain-containing protein [Deltaproteobacteria bacterium]
MKQVSLIFFSLLFAHPCLAEEGWTARLEICDPDIRSEIQTLPTPVTMLDGRTLEHKCVKTAEGKFIKLFQLTAEEILTTFYSDFEPGPAYGWGYNGSTPGPVIEAFEGERVRIEVINRLPEPTSVHWHGLELPNRMDGAAPHTQDPILPGGTFTYEFELKQYGTYMYHAHMHQHKQLALGLMGFFIIHPKLAIMPQVDHDILLFLQMWAIPPHSRIPDAMAMGDEFNFFTINGRTAPGTSPIVVNPGEEIRVRIASLNEMPHPIHLHGHTFKIVAEGAERHNLLAQPSANTVVVTAGQTAEIEFTAAEYTGDKSKPDVWMLHCHLPHHVTNNMHVPPVPGEPMAHEMAGMMTTVIIQPKESAPQDPPTSPTPPSHPHRGHGDHDHAMGPIMGRYTGSIELSNGRKFLASLDLFKVQEDGEWRKLKGVLT